MATEKRFGCQTPTSSFVLDYDRTLAPSALEAYAKTGNKAMEWQERLLRDIMAIEDGLWVHQEAGYQAPRRNGKTEIVYIREFWGLEQGEQIAHTAHRAATSHASFVRMVKLLKAAGYQEKKDYNAIKAKGSEEIELYSTGGKIQYRTRTGSGGLGEGFDLLVIDEAQEYTDSQRTALIYTVSSSPNPQTIYCGTPPTAVSKGTVFARMRRETLAGSKKYTCWHEWSVEKMTDPHDRDAWYLTNPSLGIPEGPMLTERKIEVEIGDDPADFNIQRLGLWLSYSQQSYFSAAVWDQLRTIRLPKFTGRIFVGIKYSKEGNTSMSVAVRTADNRIFVESLDCRPSTQGNDWIIAFLREADVAAVIADGASGQNLLADDMKDARLKACKLPTVKEITDANALFDNAISSKSLCHAGQVSLRQSVTNCEKRAIGNNGGYGWKSLSSDIDVGLLESAALAHWACAKAKRVRKQRMSC